MPIYGFKCNACGNLFEELLSFSQAKEQRCCSLCDSFETQRLITSPNVIFKGDGWNDKNERIKKQMRRKNKRLDKRQSEMKRDAPSVKLAPNVDGERVDTWSEAAKLAKSKGKNVALYEKKSREERKNQ